MVIKKEANILFFSMQWQFQKYASEITINSSPPPSFPPLSSLYLSLSFFHDMFKENISYIYIIIIWNIQGAKIIKWK